MEQENGQKLDSFASGYASSRVILRGMMAGAPGFEPGTSCSEGKRPIQTRLRARESEVQSVLKAFHVTELSS